MFCGIGASTAPVRSISAVGGGRLADPDGVAVGLDVVVGAAGLDALRVVLGVPALDRVVVALVDEQPLVALVVLEGAGRRVVALCRRPLVRTIVKRPLSFWPWSSNLSSPSATALRGSRVGASGSQVPQSQTMTSPAPYCLAGMTPSKSKYSIGWSSTWTAMRRIAGSRVGPFGTAQETSTPSISSRKS